MGLGAQGHVWDDELLQAFVDRGFFVIRFDNRDVGLSTKPEGIDAGVVAAGILAAFGGRAVEAPYVLADMAADAISLLDHLGIESAHIVGASMGGMIVAAIAIDHPERVRSRHVDHVDHRRPRRRPARPVGRRRCCSSRPPHDRDDGDRAQRVEVGRAIGSPAHFDEESATAPGRGLLRPLLLPGGRRPPAPRHPRLAVARPRPSARSPCRRS